MSSRLKTTVALVAFVAISQARWAAAGERFPTQDEAERRLVPVGGAPPRAPAPPPPPAVNPFVLDGGSFYDLVGRPDLAARYRTRHAWKSGLRIIGGVSLTLGALTWTMARMLEATFSSSVCGLAQQSACDPGYKTLWVPDLMMAGGLALMVVPGFWSDDPVSKEEKARLARDATARGVSWNVSAAPAPGGGTIVVGGRF
jgi:hypothetical protein